MHKFIVHSVLRLRIPEEYEHHSSQTAEEIRQSLLQLVPLSSCLAISMGKSISADLTSDSA